MKITEVDLSMRVNMNRLITITVCLAITFCFNAAAVEPGISIQGASYNGGFANLCNLLNNTKPSDLSFCLGYIKNCDYTSSQIASFILTWSPDTYRKQIPAIFISKLDRLIKILRTIEYQQLIIEIDLVRDSQLTVEQIVKLIKENQSRKK